MKVAITGASGLIGSALVGELEGRGEGAHEGQEARHQLGDKGAQRRVFRRAGPG